MTMETSCIDAVSSIQSHGQALTIGLQWAKRLSNVDDFRGPVGLGIFDGPFEIHLGHESGSSVPTVISWSP